jgi:PAS domain S-box-containing protein
MPIKNTPTPSCPQKHEKHLVMVVDDDYAARLQIRLTLENAGLEVVEATSGQKALDLFRSSQPDLVLLDIIMPEMDGFDTCRLLRDLPGGTHRPIVMVTGVDDPQTITRAFEVGATDFISKPINVLILGYRVRYWIRSGAILNELKISEDRLLKAQDIARLCLWERDLETGDFQITCHRPEIFGLTLPCSYNQLFANIASRDKESAKTLIDNACRMDKPFSVQYQITLQDGREPILLNRGEVIRDGPTQRRLVVATIQDVTEFEKVENALRESEERLKMALFGADLGTWDWHVPSGVVTFNERWASMLGYTLEEIESHVHSWENLVHPNDRPEVTNFLNQHLEGKTDHYETEHRMRHKSGEWVWVLTRGRILERDAAGRPIRACGTHLDITERKKVEDQRDRLQLQMNQIRKMESIGRLAGGVAHDFNNMLSVILGYTEIALEEIEPGSILHDSLQRVLEAGQRSANITRQLLAFARKQPIAPTNLNLNEAIEQGVLQMLRRLIGENIILAWKPKELLWRVKIDPSQIDQILVNLCLNARDAITGAGRINIETGEILLDEFYCKGHTGARPGEYVLLMVSDDGCGIKKEILDNIFEPFFTTKEVGQGTGLGLATVYGIVKQNNGYINVYSEGKGSTFSIYLPRQKDPADQLPQEAVLTAPCVDRSHETILLVEDEPMILDMITILLELKGYIVLATAIPGEAMAMAEKYPGKIHLLITDVIMPEMNGAELAGRLVSRYPDIRILYISGYTAEIIAQQGIIDVGVNYIQKPFSMEEFTLKVREVLEQHQTE